MKKEGPITYTFSGEPMAVKILKAEKFPAQF
jgi:hypothetical protein